MKKTQGILKFKFPVRISLFYLLFSTVWIVLSDRITIAVFPDPLSLSTIQTVKGMLFVVVNALMLYVLTKRHLISLEKSHQKAQEAGRLQVELEKEKELNELKSRFISMASHEYRTPLATIQLSADLLKNYADRMTDEKRKQHFTKIRDQVQYMTTLIDKVLIIGRMELGQFELDLTPLDLELFCERIVDEFRTITADTHTIDYQSTGDFPLMQVDKNMMRQIVTNLLSNAVKYAPGGGVVRVNLSREDTTAVLSVADEGIGIPDEDQHRLFETFHRATNVENISGTGLGLTITRQAVESHGGTISFESHLNTGTTFTIRLPLPASG